MCAFFVVSSWCCGRLVASGGCCCLFLSCFARLCFWSGVRDNKQHQNTHRQRSGQRKPKNEQERGGRQQAEASSSRTKQRGPGGRQQGQEEAAQAAEKGACRSSGVLRGDLDQPRVNTSVQEGRAPEKHSQHRVEGKASHRAETIVSVIHFFSLSCFFGLLSQRLNGWPFVFLLSSLSVFSLRVVCWRVQL